MPRRIILDTDTGVDDALAICLAMRSPEIDVTHITAVSGNIDVEYATANILRTLDVLAPDRRPPTARGADRPLVREPVYADEVHGGDGLGGAHALTNDGGTAVYPPSPVSPVKATAEQVILREVRATGGDITLVAVGPLTNLARCVQADPEAMRSVREIVIMGGVFDRPGNVSLCAEFNIYADPHAAAIVFECGAPITLFPLNVTEQVVLSREAVERHGGGGLGRFVRDITGHTMEFAARVEDRRGMYVHDALTIAYLVDESLFGFREARVTIETAGDIAAGLTAADLRDQPRFADSPNARIALSVDASRFLSLFEDRVLRG
jgi:purine nucleosidase